MYEPLHEQFKAKKFHKKPKMEKVEEILSRIWESKDIMKSQGYKEVLINKMGFKTDKWQYTWAILTNLLKKIKPEYTKKFTFK